jgi:hypothetical protein
MTLTSGREGSTDRALSSSALGGVASFPCAGHDRGIVEIANRVGESAPVLNRHPWTVDRGIRIRDLLLLHVVSLKSCAVTRWFIRSDYDGSSRSGSSSLVRAHTHPSRP